MNLRTILSGTAVATTLLLGAGLPAGAAAIIPLGGYTGPLQLNFNNYESFLTPQGQVTGTPAVGDQNFGIFTVQSITAPGNVVPLWTPNTNGQVLVGVFNGIIVDSVSGPVNAETTTNHGGVFDLYLVPTAAFVGAGQDQGLAGYNIPGCTVGGLCYNGITNTSGALALEFTLEPGIIPGDPTTTLTAQVNATLNPPTGTAAFQGVISSPQFAPFAFGKDSFCPNNASNCAGADGSTFALASQDPINATAIPEPSTLAAFGSGLLALGSLVGWRRKRNKAAV